MNELLNRMKPFLKTFSFAYLDAKEKFALVIILSFIALVVAVLLGASIQQRAKLEQTVTEYRLPAQVSNEDVKRIFHHLSDELYYRSYFQILPEKEMDYLIQELTLIFQQNGSKEMLLKRINETKSSVEDLAKTFSALEIPGEFFETPKLFPAVQETMRKFYYEEFKLQVLGRCYQMNYDREFQFSWDKDSQEAAFKLKNILAQLPADQRILSR
jgi:hypothetical protein